MCESVVKRNRIAKVIIAMFLLVAIICFSVACTGEIKETEEEKMINGNADLREYFRTYPVNRTPMPYYIDTQEELDKWIQEHDEAGKKCITKMAYATYSGGDGCPMLSEMSELYPKQDVKITKITFNFYWVPEEREDSELAKLPNFWKTSIFTENFQVFKGEKLKKEGVEITPNSCKWLKETMTPDDGLWFCDYVNSNTGISYNFQITELKIYFSVVK